MSVSRFFNPQRGQYISQFVPEELPTDLMLGALQQKQKQYDITDAAMVELGDWNQRALEGYDTEYTKGWKQKHEAFINDNMGKDFTSPEFQRQYRDYMKKFKSDEGLKKVQAAVEKDDAFWLRINALKQDKETYAYAEELANEYLTRRGKYTASDGLGFTGDIALGDENMLTGNDVDALAKKLYDDIKDSGSDNIKQFQDYAYKVSNNGVSTTTLNERTNQMLDHFIQGPGGNQLLKRFEKQEFGNEVPSIQIANMSEAERKDYDKRSRQYIFKYLQQASGEFEHNVSKSDLDQAKNSQMADNKTIVQIPNLEVAGFADARNEATYEDAFIGKEGKPSLIKQYSSNAENAQHNINLYKGLIDVVNSGKPINFTEDQKLMLQGLPGGNIILSGGQVSGDVKNQLIKELDKSQTVELNKLNINKTRVQELEDRYVNTVAITTNNKLYNGITFKQAFTQQKEIENDPTMKDIVAIYKSVNERDPKAAMDILQQTYLNLDKNIKEGKGAHISRQKVEKLGKYMHAIAAQNTYANEQKLPESEWSVFGVKIATTTNSDDEEKKAEKDKLFNTIYNQQSKEYVPRAQPAMKKDYRQYNEETGTWVGIVKGDQTADAKLETAMRKNLSNFIITDADTGEEIKPTIMVDGVQVPNPKYPNPETLNLESVNKEVINDMKDGKLVGTKVSMNVTGLENIYGSVTIDKIDNAQKIINQQQRRYKVIAAGLTAKSYTDAKYIENRSNYHANPNTETGKQSLVDAEMFKNLDYGTQLAKVASMNNNGQKAIMNIKIHDGKLLKEVDYTVEVVKSDLKDGQLLATVKDYKGNPVTKQMKFPNINEYNNYIKNIQQKSKAGVENAINLGYEGEPAEILIDRLDEENAAKAKIDAVIKVSNDKMDNFYMQEENRKKEENYNDLRYKRKKNKNQVGKIINN